MIKPEPTPDYLIILHPLVSDIPPIIRLRRFLNAALRAYGLRCLDHRIIGDGGNARDPGALVEQKVSEVGRQSAGALPLESGPATATPAGRTTNGNA